MIPQKEAPPERQCKFCYNESSKVALVTSHVFAAPAQIKLCEFCESMMRALRPDELDRWWCGIFYAGGRK